MSYHKYAPDLFMAVNETLRQNKFLDEDGFRRNIKENTVSFGLIKSKSDPSFSCGRVTQDSDNGSGQKCIKVAPIAGIDSNYNFITSEEEIKPIPLAANDQWYWLKVAHQFTNVEKGVVSIAPNGDMTGVGTEFTKTLRGQPDFPMKIVFVDSAYNVAEFEVLSVISDTSCVLANPLINTATGIAEFIAEDNLHYACVATFTPGVIIPDENKFPWNYDSALFTLVPETSSNVRPSYVQGQEFYIARVKCSSGGTVTIQDKRVEYWETKGSELAINITREPSPLIGVEKIVWQTKSNPASQNLVTIGYGFRSTNFSINTTQNILTLASGAGGVFLSVNDFNDGDFDGWRVYYSNGRYSNIISSYTASGAINLVLDMLDCDNFSSNGGTSLFAQELVVVPNCEAVEVKFTSDAADSTPSVNKVVVFPINTGIGVAEIEAYKAPSCLYNVQYRYISHKESTGFSPIVSSETGYLTEDSFDSNGVLLGTPDQECYPYTADTTDAFIQVQQAPWCYNNFQNQVYIGDVLSVYTIPSLAASSIINLTVSVDPYYQRIVGTHTIASDVSFVLGSGVKGNKFTLHFDASDINLNGNQILIKQTDGVTILKTLAKPDFYEMKNIDGGIIINLVHNGTVWCYSQNYGLGTGGELKMLDVAGTPLSSLFDTTVSVANAKGKSRGLWGWALCNASGTVDGISLPNLSASFIIGQGTSPLDSSLILAPGNTGGEVKHNLTENELPEITPTFEADPHSHNFEGHEHGHKFFFRLKQGQSGTDFQTGQFDGGSNGNLGYEDGTGSDTGGFAYTATAYVANEVAGGTNSSTTITGTVSSFGAGEAHNNLPPYYAVVYIKRLY